MAEPFIFISSSGLKEGKREAYEKQFQRVADKVEEREPKMAHFSLYVSEDGTEVSTFQVHTDADNMAYHMEVIAEHVEEAREFLDFSKMSIQVFGNPSPEVLGQMRQLAGSGVAVSVKTPVAGFNRFAIP